MAFSVKELAISMATIPGQDDQGWMVVIGCGRSVLGCTGTVGGDATVRQGAIDSAQGLRSKKDLEALKKAMRAMEENLRWLDNIPDPVEE